MARIFVTFGPLHHRINNSHNPSVELQTVVMTDNLQVLVLQFDIYEVTEVIISEG